MIVAVLGASKADLAAIDSALAAIEEEGIATIVSTGGHAFGGGQAGQALARLQSYGIPTVHGEGDRLVGRFHRKRKQLARDLSDENFVHAETAYASLNSAQVEWLNTLPKIVRRTVDGVDLVVMSAPTSANATGTRLEEDDDRLRRLREEANAPLVIVGGEEPFSRECDGSLFVCPGTMIAQEDPAVVRYAVVSTESQPWQAELRAVPLVSV